MAPRLAVAIERFPIAGSFTISRGSRTEAVVVTATITDGAATGRGECVPYARYGESVEGVAAAIEAMAEAVAGGLDRAALQRTMPAERPATPSTARSSTSRRSRAAERRPRSSASPRPARSSPPTR